MKRFYLSGVLCVLVCALFAGELKWQTHFAYNNVEQIALYDGEVYALANGKMFSINQVTEFVTLYNNQSGLHGTEIVQLVTDTVRNQLLIIYIDGKVDVMYNGRIHYISDLYNKKMTASKRCNNVTINGDIAYLSMDFGILTFDLNRYEFKDTYYIGDEAKEVQVLDVMLLGDSIYAKTADGVYTASLADNIVDFRYWKVLPNGGVVFDKTKGKEYINQRGDVWKVVGTQGVYCRFVTGDERYYLPEGPQVNVPYRMCVENGRLYVVPGGRWAVQESKPGNVMIYKNGSWTNITNDYIQGKTGKRALDFMNVAVDPSDEDHFYVTSYGTGLYEFRGDTLVKHYTPSNSILGTAVADHPDSYTRTDNAVFDEEGRLWVQVASNVDVSLVALLSNGENKGINLHTDNKRYIYYTPGGLIIDPVHLSRKWMLSCRNIPALILLDDGGTPFDEKDDKLKVQSEFYDQDGSVIVPEFMYTMAQGPNGDIWVGTSVGPIIIPHNTDFFQSNQCMRLRIKMPDGGNFLDLERVNAFEWDDDGNIWIGTQTSGVYVVNLDEMNILSCYTSDNTVMPSNMVMSLAYDEIAKRMYIGTGAGLVSVSLSQDMNATFDDDVIEDEVSYGNMYQWRSHAAFTSMDEIVLLGDDVYTLSSQSLFSVNKKTELIDYYTRLTGLNGSRIDHIAHNTALQKMLITYQDGQLDIIDSSREIKNISDLYLKQMSVSKEVNDICMYQNKAYLAMKFGILVVDMLKMEIEDTYYIGLNSTEVDVDFISINNEKIYAASQFGLYVAKLSDNLTDYNFWQKEELPGDKDIQGMRAHNGCIYLLQGNQLYVSRDNQWRICSTKISPRKLCKTPNHLYVLPDTTYGVAEIQDVVNVEMVHTYGYVNAVAEDENSIWFATKDDGVVKYNNDIYKPFFPDGPSSNNSYRLRFFGDRLYMLPGGRWATQFNRLGEIMIYENGEWTNIKNGNLVEKANHAIYDVMNVAQDPRDPEHYFVTTYGTGMLEMRADSVVKLFLPSNSDLQSAAANNPDFYTRTDGAMFDEQGNLWVLNMGNIDYNLRVINSNGDWYPLELFYNNIRVPLYTAGEILVDRRNSQWKWIPILRSNTGLVLLQDNGTPTKSSDDKVIYRSEWMDQNGHLIAPEFIYCMVQDYNNTIWVGTSKGLFIIKQDVDFSNSNACERIIIPRNDGTQLGDYLLENEQINTIVIDGANRIWIGTASSGLYLMQFTESTLDADYTLEMVSHFTTENSLLPSNDILSIAIQESTGEVFVGTGSGLVSYMSDAVEPEEDFNDLYVYPNPVYPNYHGQVVIKGLVKDTQIRIVDASGNLLKILQSNGGESVWDMTNATGSRVASGVYTVLCNSYDGQIHASVKILIMN